MRHERVASLVGAVQRGDGSAYDALVRLTRPQAASAALAILHDPVGVDDVLQDAYLTAYQRLGTLRAARTFEAWLLRIVRRTALDRIRRANRRAQPLPQHVATGLVVSGEEPRWRALEAAIVQLPATERRMFERFYIGRWSAARIALQSGLKEATVRKRLERIRTRLREEIQKMTPLSLPEHVIALLARPVLTDLPENPVGAIWSMLRAALPAHEVVEPPERVDLARLGEILGVEARHATPYPSFAGEQSGQIIRGDLTAPLLIHLAGQRPQAVIAGGRVYRPDKVDAMHLQAFHQADVITVRADPNPWAIMSWMGPLIEQISGGASIRIEPHNFTPYTAAAWEVWVLHEGRWLEVCAWGVFRDEITAALGHDPAQVTTFGAGFGLERLASIRYHIDDIRKIEATCLDG
ncbi:MAG: sigma-70 family RNA polymerase sigma factor [Myxococcota bacterium]